MFKMSREFDVKCVCVHKGLMTKKDQKEEMIFLTPFLWPSWVASHLKCIEPSSGLIMAGWQVGFAVIFMGSLFGQVRACRHPIQSNGKRFEVKFLYLGHYSFSFSL